MHQQKRTESKNNSDKGSNVLVNSVVSFIETAANDRDASMPKLSKISRNRKETRLCELHHESDEYGTLFARITSVKDKNM